MGTGGLFFYLIYGIDMSFIFKWIIIPFPGDKRQPLDRHSAALFL